jgi:hypothetical protein
MGYILLYTEAEGGGVVVSHRMNESKENQKENPQVVPRACRYTFNANITLFCLFQNICARYVLHPVMKKNLKSEVHNNMMSQPSLVTVLVTTVGYQRPT